MMKLFLYEIQGDNQGLDTFDFDKFLSLLTNS